MKIGPVDPEIIWLKLKKEETRNAWQSIAYSPLGAVVSPPQRILMKHTYLPIAALPSAPPLLLNLPEVATEKISMPTVQLLVS